MYFLVDHHQSNALQLTAHGDHHHHTSASQGLQTLTMTNASPTSATNSTGGTTIVQYAQGPDGQFYIPGTHQILDNLCHIVIFFISTFQVA